jgi:two-component system LytT family response regulator
MKLRSFIVDDEVLSRTLLHSLLTEYCPEVELVGEADCADQALPAIEQRKPDLVFLDVEMPMANGFDLLRGIESRSFKTIFVTAHREYAIQAIKAGGSDYILKPIDIDELRSAVSRIFLKWKTDAHKFSNPEELDQIIAVNHSRGFKIISLRNIVRLEADNNYTYMYLADEPRILVTRSITETGELLMGSEWFFRTHRSHIINFYHFKEYLKEDGGYAVMRDGKKVSLSRLRLEEFFEMVKRFAHHI